MQKYLILPLLGFAHFFHAQTTRNVGDFNVVRAYDKLNVELVHASQAKVEVYSTSSDDVEVLNKNGELKIRMVATKLLQGDDTKIKVYYKDLNEIQASQGSNIWSNQTLDANQLSLISNEGSKINLKLDVKDLSVKSNSGGSLELSGKADKQDVLVNAGAQYDGQNLVTQSTDVTANAGGEAEVYAEKKVNAKTRAGGNIEIYGNPKDRNSKKVMGGSIVFKK